MQKCLVLERTSNTFVNSTGEPLVAPLLPLVGHSISEDSSITDFEREASPPASQRSGLADSARFARRLAPFQSEVVLSEDWCWARCFVFAHLETNTVATASRRSLSRSRLILKRQKTRKRKQLGSKGPRPFCFSRLLLDAMSSADFVRFAHFEGSFGHDLPPSGSLVVILAAEIPRPTLLPDTGAGPVILSWGRSLPSS